MVLVELIKMRLYVSILDQLRHFLLHFNALNVLLVLALLELDVALIFERSIKMKHIISNQCLHLHRIKVLLVCEHVSDRSLYILKLLKFNIQHVVKGFEVLAHIVNRYFA